MSDHDQFDAEKLFHLKDNHCGYRFCPRCGADLAPRKLDGCQRMVCSSEDCGFIFYQNPVPAAGAIVIKDERILLVKRAHPPQIGWWCIPAGFMEWREHPRETAIRELKEETGLIVELKSFFEVYSGTDDPRANCILMLYLATEVGGQLQAADDALDVRYFSFDDLPEKIAFEAHHQALADYTKRYRS